MKEVLEINFKEPKKFKGRSNTNLLLRSKSWSKKGIELEGEEPIRKLKGLKHKRKYGKRF